MTTSNNLLLDVRDLKTYFRSRGGIARAVDGVSFSIKKGQTLALVGESGCGKSMTALSIMQLIPQPPGYVEGGEIWFNGRDLLEVPSEQMREVRGGQIAMIFQEPLTSLNPVFTIGYQLKEALRLHRPGSERDLQQRALDALRRVGLPDPEQRMNSYPFQLSGGQQQRVMIAMALACEPELLIADEPTTALDVTIQAQILRLLKQLQEETGLGLLLITHDLGVVNQVADDVAVMYAGMIVERAPRYELFKDPQHPYTRGLMASLPGQGQRGKNLYAIPGIVPRATEWPSGCRFRTRCSQAFEPCPTAIPALMGTAERHRTRCYLYGLEGEDHPPQTSEKEEQRTEDREQRVKG